MAEDLTLWSLLCRIEVTHSFLLWAPGCDDDAPIAATPTDEDLLQCEDDINEEEEIQERVEPSDAISAVQVLKQFLVEADSISPDFLSTLAEIEFFVESCHFQ